MRPIFNRDMGITGHEAHERNMATVAGGGAGYWTVQGDKEGAAGEGMVPNPLKALPEPTTEEVQERREVFSRWAVDGTGTEPPESEWEATEATSQWRGNSVITPRNISAEVWCMGHVAVVIIYWVNFLVVALWQLMVWLLNVNTKFTDSGCTTLRVQYITNALGTLLCSPFVFYICSCTLLELQSKMNERLLNVYSVMSDERPKPMTDIWLSWSTGKLLVACMVCVLSVFEFGWWLTGIAWVMHYSSCGDFSSQGEVMALFSSVFVTACSTIVALGTVMYIRNSKKQTLTSIQPSYPPQNRLPATPTSPSPKNSARIALQALKSKA